MRAMQFSIFTILSGVLLVFFVNCTKEQEVTLSAESLEVTQQVGDILASVDEFGGNANTIASYEKFMRRDFARYAPHETEVSVAAKLFLPEAQAASCSSVGYTLSCGSGTMQRSFGGCTVGGVTFNGTVNFAWSSGNTCALAVGQSVTRSPNITATGRLGATLAITKTGTEGQRLTYPANTTPKVFSFTSDGINRKFTNSSGVVTMDFTTSTTTAVTVTGADRAGRVLNGGVIQVVNNLNATTCTFTPSALTWNGSCNCPVSGSLAGTCTGGDGVSISITGCGVATVSYNAVSESVTFDRCGN